MIDPIQFVLADAECVDDHTGTDIANIDASSSEPISQPKQLKLHKLLNLQ